MGSKPEIGDYCILWACPASSIDCSTLFCDFSKLGYDRPPRSSKGVRKPVIADSQSPGSRILDEMMRDTQMGAWIPLSDPTALIQVYEADKWTIPCTEPVLLGKENLMKPTTNISSKYFSLEVCIFLDKILICVVKTLTDIRETCCKRLPWSCIILSKQSVAIKEEWKPARYWTCISLILVGFSMDSNLQATYTSYF